MFDGASGAVNSHGANALQLGATTATSGDSSATQTFTAPGAGTLSFFYNITCPDTIANDWATATLTDNTARSTTTVLPKTCSSAAGWQQIGSPVVSGHSYTLTLTNHDDGNSANPTSTQFENVTVTTPGTQPIRNSGFTATAPGYAGRIASDAASSTTATTSLTLRPTRAVTAGDTLVVSMMLTNTDTGTPAVTDSQGDTYTVAADKVDGFGDRVLVFTAPVGSGLSGTDAINLSWPKTLEHHVTVDDFVGVGAVDHSIAAVGAAGTFMAGPTGASPGQILVGAAGIQGGNPGTWTSPANTLPNLYLPGNTTGDQLDTAWQSVTASGDCDHQWLAALTVLKPTITGWSTVGAAATVFVGARNTPVLDTTKSLSVSAWAKLSATTGTADVVTIDGRQASAFSLRYDKTANAWAFTRPTTDAASPTLVKATGPTGPATGSWTHLVGTYDAATGLMTLYINGQAVGTATDTTPFAATGALAIGRGLAAGTQTDWFPGSISAPQVYSRADRRRGRIPRGRRLTAARRGHRHHHLAARPARPARRRHRWQRQPDHSRVRPGRPPGHRLRTRGPGRDRGRHPGHRTPGHRHRLRHVR